MIGASFQITSYLVNKNFTLFFFKGIDFYTSITRARFEELCGDLFKTTMDPVETALKDAKYSKDQVQFVVNVL